jgi:hypothetical protein
VTFLPTTKEEEEEEEEENAVRFGILRTTGVATPRAGPPSHTQHRRPPTKNGWRATRAAVTF